MTIKDIARESGYAVGTVSRVLNGHPDVSDAAREKIMAVVEKNHFRLNNNAKHLKQQASAGIAVVARGTRNMFFATIVECLQQHIKDRGYLCLVYYIEEDEDEMETALQICRERRPQGIIFLGRNMKCFEARFHLIKVPCVLLTNSARTSGFPNLSSVATDDEEAAQAAMEHLIGLGHRHIGVLGGRLEGSQTTGARYQGVLRALERHGLPFDPDLQYEPARFSMADGYRAMGRLLDRMEGITAVFAMSDVAAVGAIRAIGDRGLTVPGDVSVMGFDGIELGQYLTPQLTTIRQNAGRIATRGVELLLSQIAGGTPAVHEIVPYCLIPGESAAAIKNPCS